MPVERAGHPTRGRRRRVPWADGAHAVRKDLGPPRRPRRAGRAGARLRRPASRPRGHVAPGLRGTPPGGAPRAPARPHRRDDGPQRSDAARADHGPDGEGAARCPASELRRVRDRAVRDGVGPRGHRPRDRPRARAHAAGEDDRLRRQPHVDPRGVRRTRVRHRHVRGRARARDADARAAAARRRCCSSSPGRFRPG